MGGKNKLLKTFYQDGIFYFICLSSEFDPAESNQVSSLYAVLSIINIFIFLLAPGNGMQLLIVQYARFLRATPPDSVANSYLYSRRPQVHFSALLATRMLLHLREWASKQQIVMITTTDITLGSSNLNSPKPKLVSEEYAMSDFTVYQK